MKKSGRAKLIIGFVICFAAVICCILAIIKLTAKTTVAEGDIYFIQDHLTKMEAPLNEKMIDHVTNRFSYIDENYLKPQNITPYLCVIPDKNYYLNEDKQKRALDYEALISKVTNDNSYMNYIDITDLLSLDDYYVTDSHWKQECITDVAERIAEKLGVSALSDGELLTLEQPFYGVYYEDGEDRVSADTIHYLDHDILRACTVTAIGEKKELAIYDIKKAETESPYEMFLSGTVALMSVENPNANSDKKLIVFRDSFASSLVPLLIPEYREVILVDIRYVQSQALGQLIDFSDADVLFIYSTLLLNNSLGMK